tara:strand:- start:101 stop:592 length:492 start_codon:yes stop_codon:yes gene_type:complete
MRNDADTWMKEGFDFTLPQNNVFNGLVSPDATVLIIPRSDEAKMDCLMKHGFNVDENKNGNFFQKTMDGIGVIKSHHLRLLTNSHLHLQIGSAVLSSYNLKTLNKKYKRKTDELVVLQGAEDDWPLTRFVSPCRDWWFVLAPCTQDRTGTRVGLGEYHERWLE